MFQGSNPTENDDGVCSFVTYSSGLLGTMTAM